jgi:hypothetical protein
MAAFQRLGSGAVTEPPEDIDFVPQRIHALQLIRAAEVLHNGSRH